MLRTIHGLSALQRYTAYRLCTLCTNHAWQGIDTLDYCRGVTIEDYHEYYGLYHAH